MSDLIENYTELLKDLVENQKNIDKTNNENDKNNLLKRQQEIMTSISNYQFDRNEIRNIFNTSTAQMNVETNRRLQSTIANMPNASQRIVDTVNFQNENLNNTIDQAALEEKNKMEEQLQRSAIPVTKLVNYQFQISNLLMRKQPIPKETIERLEYDIEKYEQTKKSVIEKKEKQNQTIQKVKNKIKDFNERMHENRKKAKKATTVEELQALIQEQEELLKEEKDISSKKENITSQQQDIEEQLENINPETINDAEKIQMDTNSIENLGNEIKENKEYTLDSILEEYENKNISETNVEEQPIDEEIEEEKIENEVSIEEIEQPVLAEPEITTEEIIGQEENENKEALDAILQEYDQKNQQKNIENNISQINEKEIDKKEETNYVGKHLKQSLEQPEYEGKHITEKLEPIEQEIQENNVQNQGQINPEMMSYFIETIRNLQKQSELLAQEREKLLQRIEMQEAVIKSYKEALAEIKEMVKKQKEENINKTHHDLIPPIDTNQIDNNPTIQPIVQPTPIDQPTPIEQPTPIVQPTPIEQPTSNVQATPTKKENLNTDELREKRRKAFYDNYKMNGSKLDYIESNGYYNSEGQRRR